MGNISGAADRAAILRDLRLRLGHEPGPDYRIRLLEELIVGIERQLVPSCPDPGLDRVRRQPPHFIPQLGSAMPLSLLCFTLGPGCGSLRFLVRDRIG